MLSRKFGYQHVSMDSINAGFEKVFPELGINTSANLPPLDILRNISQKIAPFIRAMLDSGEYDEFEPGMALDVFQLLPKDYMEHLHGANCEIFYFITSDVTPEERLDIMKANDTANHYSFYKQDEELRRMCENIIIESRYIKEQCVKYKLPFYETARNRERVFEEFIHSIYQSRAKLDF